MSSSLILTCVLAYSALLFFIVWLTSRNATNETFFIGNRSSRWYVVAYGMIGASLSGVTFMSVPGDVGSRDFSYFQMVLGYLLGYWAIAFVLLPIYYKMNLTSIYTYLKTRLGLFSYKTGALFFIISRVVGASFRLYIVVYVLQRFVFDAWNMPFWVTVLIFILLILAYTFKGGVKTIVWTDSLQTTFMILSLVLSVILISREMNFSFSGMVSAITSTHYANWIDGDWRHRFFFPKDFFGGMFIAIAMTGLDQEMMQKNISVKTLGASQKNVIVFSIVLVFINLLFLSLGALLYIYAQAKGMAIPAKTDDMFPTIALHSLGTLSAIFFIIGLISAAYPSADGALTALTSSFCIDFLGFQNRNDLNEKQKISLRQRVHLCFALVLFLVIMLFYAINDEAVVRQVFKFATYTYGPLLGLFLFGILTKKQLKDNLAPYICIASPLICFVLDRNSKEFFNGYQFGNELLILNGGITFIGLWMISKRSAKLV